MCRALSKARYAVVCTLETNRKDEDRFGAYNPYSAETLFQRLSSIQELVCHKLA